VEHLRQDRLRLWRKPHDPIRKGSVTR
jgi:hypothetical protein